MAMIDRKQTYLNCMTVEFLVALSVNESMKMLTENALNAETDPS